MKVGIVGAGITGLALTHYLEKQGIDSITFDAAEEPGGVIQTRHSDGRVLEVGPQRMRKSPAITELISVAGVEDDSVEAPAEQLYVYTDGALRRAPLSIETFFRTDLLSWPGKLRLLAEPLTRPGMKQETAGELFVRKFGREAYEKFIGPLYGGIYGSDPDEMPAAYALESLLEREQKTGSFLQAFRQRVTQGQSSPPISFARGMQQFPNALYQTYHNRIELDTAVANIDRLSGDRKTNGHVEEGMYVLETSCDRYEVDHVVLTTPAHVTADLLGTLATGTSGLRNLRYNPLAMVYLAADPDHEGFGYQVAFGETLQTLGASWNASMFDRNGVYTVFLGGMHEPAILDESDDELGRIARDEFETVMDCPASVIDVARLEPGFPAWDHSWWALEHLELPAGITLATNYTGRMGIPSRVREAREIAETFLE